MRRTSGTGTALTLAIVSAGLMIALAGCVTGTATPSASPTVATPGATAEPEPSRELDLAGTAEDNLLYFSDTNKALIRAGGSLDGRAFIDNLVAAGFPKAAMEVTPDRTSINAEVDQLQFSVRLNGTCLIGQYGGGRYNTSATTLLADGKCLIGETRDIDW